MNLSRFELNVIAIRLAVLLVELNLMLFKT